MNISFNANFYIVSAFFYFHPWCFFYFAFIHYLHITRPRLLQHGNYVLSGGLSQRVSEALCSCQIEECGLKRS